MLTWATSPTKKLNQNNQTEFTTVDSFRLSDLADQKLLPYDEAWQQFQTQTDLADLYWEAVYPAHLSLSQALQQADGIAIFLHGCNGSHETWEDLPQRLVERYPKLVCLNPDIYGFGNSPLKTTPSLLKQVSMAAAMNAIDLWLELLGLGPTQQSDRFHLFIGHSMGGGMLFYHNEQRWQNRAYGCYLLSPSIFCNDWLRRWLYQLTGLASLLPYITPLKRYTLKWVIQGVMNGASAAVREIHGQFSTPFSTIQASMCGIGRSPQPPRLEWSQYRLVMGHNDIVVNPEKIITFATRLGFKPQQIQIVQGDHYFFSHDEHSPATHRHSRQVVLDNLTAFCQQLAQTQTSSASQSIRRTPPLMPNLYSTMTARYAHDFFRPH